MISWITKTRSGAVDFFSMPIETVKVYIYIYVLAEVKIHKSHLGITDIRMVPILSNVSLEEKYA